MNALQSTPPVGRELCQTPMGAVRYNAKLKKNASGTERPRSKKRRAEKKRRPSSVPKKSSPSKNCQARTGGPQEGQHASMQPAFKKEKPDDCEKKRFSGRGRDIEIPRTKKNRGETKVCLIEGRDTNYPKPASGLVKEVP